MPPSNSPSPPATSGSGNATPNPASTPPPKLALPPESSPPSLGTILPQVPDKNTLGSPSASVPAITQADYDVLTQRGLLIPVAGVNPQDLRDSFDELRGGNRRHGAIDILAPRGTPVMAVDDGLVKKLFTSVPGGLTIYEFDRETIYCYYYAHLDHYASGLKEGMWVKRGDLLGYVGTTGDAPANTPHLHFEIEKLGPEKHYWQGASIDPFPILKAGLSLSL